MPGAERMLSLKIPHPKGYAGSIPAPGTMDVSWFIVCCTLKPAFRAGFFVSGLIERFGCHMTNGNPST
jgi:hypothetical protein